jgi:hypothetical protein
MSDYGHPLTFGSFLTPTNSDVVTAVQLAVLAEEVGLDLVTFQDHPYQPRFLDTWTLLSFVAARTTRGPPGYICRPTSRTYRFAPRRYLVGASPLWTYLVEVASISA